jgi:uncharacterized protein (TIGR03118 family)
MEESMMKSISKIARCKSTLLVFAVALGCAQSAFADSVYVQHNLVSDGASGLTADHVDSNLQNAWGITFAPGSPMWVANNGTSTATIYNGSGVAASLIVAVTGMDPTGIVWNGSSSFNVAPTTPARFIWATESGTIDAWAGGTSSTVMQTVDGAVFKGVALSGTGSGLQLYVTDFANGQIDVFDANFAPVTLTGNAFKDPTLPGGSDSSFLTLLFGAGTFNPFGIQAIGGNIYVTFAKTQPGSTDEAHGPGSGFVDVFDPSGNFLHRIGSRGVLNAPWGLALAPAGFGEFGGALLVGNFGDGRINAFDPVHGGYLGTLRGADGQPIAIDGLWGLAFGNGAQDQPVNTLFFAAGPNDEADGLYGRIDVQPGSDNGDDQGGDNGNQN